MSTVPVESMVATLASAAVGTVLMKDGEPFAVKEFRAYWRKIPRTEGARVCAWDDAELALVPGVERFTIAKLEGIFAVPDE